MGLVGALVFLCKQETAYDMRISDGSSDVCSSDLRDPVVAEVTRRCDWRIVDIVGGKHPTTLYLVVPPSDINRTKPLIRLILNQVGRRLTEDLQAKGNRHRLLLMLDEFPALGRLDFFESALAFMADRKSTRLTSSH